MALLSPGIRAKMPFLNIYIYMITMRDRKVARKAARLLHFFPLSLSSLSMSVSFSPLSVYLSLSLSLLYLSLLSLYLSFFPSFYLRFSLSLCSASYSSQCIGENINADIKIRRDDGLTNATRIHLLKEQSHLPTIALAGTQELGQSLLKLIFFECTAMLEENVHESL